MAKNIRQIVERAQKFYEKYCLKHLKTNDYDYALVSARYSYQTATKRAIKYESKEEKINSKMKRFEDEKKIVNFLITGDFKLESIAKLAHEIRNDYQKVDVHDFLYGNAQKWINMSIKYFLISKSSPNDKFDYDLFKQLQDKTNYSIMPVDGIMIKKNKELLKISFEYSSWSRCDDLNAFISYWQRLQKEITDQSLIEYELVTW